MRQVSAWVGAGMISVIVFVIGAGAGATTGCEEADRLLDEGLVEDARVAYVELVERTPPPQCALQGIREIAQRRSTNPSLELGSAYEAAEKYEEARALYVELLREDPTWTEARDALTRAQQRLSPEGDPFAAARSLAAADDDTAAADALREVVNETGKAVPGDLKYLLGGKPGFWREAKAFAARWWEFAAFVLAIVLGGVYLLLRRFRKTYLEIQDFDKGTTEHDIGKGLSARVKEELKKLNDQGGRQQVNMVSGPLQDDAFLAELTPLVPQAAIFWQVIDRLLPRRVATVTGYLHESDGHVGLTLTLTEGHHGRLLSSKTIWGDEFRPSDNSASKEQESYRDLLEPAAIWILYHLHHWIEKPKSHKNEKNEGADEDGNKRKKKDRQYERLGATNWFGYALFRVGVRQAVTGNEDAAREMYQKALDRDAHNRGALFNLGYLVSSSQEEEDYVEALELLRRAKKGAEEAGSWEVEIVWYLSSYWIAAIQYHRNESGEALEIASEVHGQAEETLNELEKSRLWWPSGFVHARKPWKLPFLVLLFKRQRWRLQRQDNERLRRWLEEFEPMTLVVYGAILASQENGELDDKEAEEIREKIEDLAKKRERPPRLSYNLACYYSVLGQHSDENADTCYEKALEQLVRSLEDGGHFTEQAADDPSLQGVRENELTKNRFRDLLERYRARQEAQCCEGIPLARLALIGNHHAKRLKDAGVVRSDDLIEKAGTPEAREAMASELGVSLVLLERWALLADLMRVAGIEAEEAGLLDEARVGSLDALKWNDPEDLANLLDQLNQAHPPSMQPPKVDEVQAWIEEANKLQPWVRVRYWRNKYPAIGYLTKKIRNHVSKWR